MSSSPVVANRWQQAIPAGLVLALAAWVAYVSFNVEDPEPYLFPRLVAVLLLGLSAFAFVRAVSGGSQTGGGLDGRTLMNVLPGVAVMFTLVFFLADWLGFYVASAAAFLALYALYDPASHADAKVWGKRIVITAGFMAVMYGLFALVLKVQTPRGIFF